MKLLIEIPEEIYKSCKAIYKLPVKKEEADAYTYAIANGNAYTYPIATGIPLPINQRMFEEMAEAWANDAIKRCIKEGQKQS